MAATSRARLLVGTSCRVTLGRAGSATTCHPSGGALGLMSDDPSSSARPLCATLARPRTQAPAHSAPWPAHACAARLARADVCARASPCQRAGMPPREQPPRVIAPSRPRLPGAQRVTPAPWRCSGLVCCALACLQPRPGCAARRACAARSCLHRQARRASGTCARVAVQALMAAQALGRASWRVVLAGGPGGASWRPRAS